MARRGMTGQLNMFDLLYSQEATSGEVEMVSLVPDFEEEPEIEEIRESEDVAMSRTYVVNHEQIEIAYINYNKVRITIGDKAPILKEFASSKEAVDYYVEQMQEYEIDE